MLRYLLTCNQRTRKSSANIVIEVAIVFVVMTGLWLLVVGIGAKLMKTTCERCTEEVDDNEIGKCDECDRDGLCQECQPHHIHEDDEGGDE